MEFTCAFETSRPLNAWRSDHVEIEATRNQQPGNVLCFRPFSIECLLGCITQWLQLICGIDVWGLRADIWVDTDIPVIVLVCVDINGVIHEILP